MILAEQDRSQQRGAGNEKKESDFHNTSSHKSLLVRAIFRAKDHQAVSAPKCHMAGCKRQLAYVAIGEPFDY